MGKLSWSMVIWCSFLSSIYFCFFYFHELSMVFSTILSPFKTYETTHPWITLQISDFVNFENLWVKFTCYARFCMYFGALGWACVHSLTKLGFTWITADGWDYSHSVTMLDNVFSNQQANWNCKSGLILSCIYLLLLLLSRQSVLFLLSL